jgi:uncharacterized protein YggE
MKFFPLFVLTLMMALIPSVAQASDDGSPQDILTVSAQGEVRIPANLATVSLAIETTGKTAEAAQTDAARRANAVVAFLKTENVKNLQTTQVTLNPEYRFDQGKNTLIGYRAVQSLSFETSATEAGRQIDQAVVKGASRVDFLTFRADEDSRKKAETEALTRAAENARAKGKTVLEALGLTWQRIAFINVNPLETLPPQPRNFQIRAMSADAAPAPSPTLGGQDTVSVSVQMGIVYR